MILSTFIDFFSIDNVFFTVDNRSISVLELLSIFFGLTSVYLASKGKVINYWLNYIYTIFLFLLLLQKHVYTSMLILPVCLVINIFGLYRWTHPKVGEANNSNSLRASFLTNKQRLFYPLCVIVFALLWGYFLAHVHTLFGGVIPPATQPYLDAFVAGMTILAQWLAALKKWECWLTWVVVNLTNVILYILSGLVFMPVLAAVYLLFNAIGIIHWHKESMQKEQ